MTDAELAEVKELLVAQRPLLRSYWSDATAVDQGLASGELVASYAWPYSVAALKAQGVNVEYMIPKEGVLTWSCGLMVLKDHPGPEQAIADLIDAMLSPETGDWAIETLGVGHANRVAFERADPSVLAGVGMADPQRLFDKGVLFRPIEDDLRARYDELLLEVKAGG